MTLKAPGTDAGRRETGNGRGETAGVAEPIPEAPDIEGWQSQHVQPLYRLADSIAAPSLGSRVEAEYGRPEGDPSALPYSLSRA